MKCYFSVVRSVSMARRYVAGALFCPNGMRFYSYVSKFVVNFVLSRPLDAKRIYQYPKLESRVLKTFASPRLSINSSILGIWYASRTVMAFRRP